MENTQISEKLINHKVKNKLQGKLKIFWTDTEDIIYQNLWDTAKAVHRRTFMALNAYIKK